MAILKTAEVLKLLRLKPGTITVCTYDERRPEKSGKRVTYVDCMLTGLEDKTPEGNSTGPEDSQGSAEASTGKNPHFRVNRTTNIRCANASTVTIHPILIETYNGIRVTP